MSEGDGGGGSAESSRWEENGGNEQWWGSQEWVRIDKGGEERGRKGGMKGCRERGVRKRIELRRVWWD